MAEKALDLQTHIRSGSVLSVDYNVFQRKYWVWRSPFSNPRPSQEILNIVMRCPHPRDATIDFPIAQASSMANHLSFEIMDVKRSGSNYFSQVFFGKLEGTNKTICVKLFDERLFPSICRPAFGKGIRPEMQLLDINYMDDMMHREEGVYGNHMKYLQGSMILHCCSFHVVHLLLYLFLQHNYRV